MTTTHTVEDALAKFDLINGAGDGQTKACVMTALSWVAGEAWTDKPECAHRLIASLAIKANDHADTTAEQRAEIVRLGAEGIIDTWWVPTPVVLSFVAVKEGEPNAPLDVIRRVASGVADWKRAAAKQRPDLYGANLYGADLYGANLYGANLYGANLYGANLSSANLYGADLYGANLYGANLRSANLYGANLSSANLYGANLYGANLRSANLYGANLSSANLYGANLRSANLYGANLSSANLSSANLSLSADGVAYGDTLTQLPAGWKLSEAGLIVKETVAK